MEEIKRQVARARRRMNFAQFLWIVSWSLTAALAVALVGVLVPRFWVISVDADTWTWSWIGGSAVTGLIVGWLIAFLKRRGDLEAAIELDRRYGLKERVSSSLSLTEEERQSEFGQALLTDAARRVERIDVREHFGVPVSWRTLLPLAPALAMFAIIFFVPLAQSNLKASPDNEQRAKESIKKAATELEKRLAIQKKEAEEKGLKEAQAALDELSKQAQKLKSGDAADRKEAIVKLNDMAKELQKRKNEIAANEKFQKQLQDLKDLDKGPADKVVDAMKEGNLAEAAKEMGKLLDELKNGQMNKEDAEKLAKQLEQVQKKIEDLRAKHEQKKKELEEQIEQKKQAGELGEAAKLQQQLDQLKQQDKQMNGAMKKMADQMGQAAQKLKEGDQQAAAQQMQEMAQELQEMQDQLAEGESLQEALDQLEEAKDAMNCDKCNGEGCKHCQGNGKKKGQGGKKDGPPGDGLGEGQGYGARPEEATDTKGYKAREKGNVGKGKSVRVGDATGKNIAGKAQQATSEEVVSSLAKDPDPIDETGLPRDQREHSKEYFEKLLKGE
jgi:septal ring factor EnvC (AmiA/AmiB activator)